VTSRQSDMPGLAIRSPQTRRDTAFAGRYNTLSH
jgi:hypothetical protein